MATFPLTIVVNTFGLDTLGQDLEFQVSPGTSIRDLKAMVEDRSGRDATKLFIGHLNPDDFMEMHSTECQDDKTVADYFQPGHDFFLPIQVATVATQDGEVSVAVDPVDRVCDLVRNLPNQEGTLRADGTIVSGSECVDDFALDAWSTNIDEVDGGGRGAKLKVPEGDRGNLNAALVQEFDGFVDKQTSIKNQLAQKKISKEAS